MNKNARAPRPEIVSIIWMLAEAAIADFFAEIEAAELPASRANVRAQVVDPQETRENRIPDSEDAP